MVKTIQTKSRNARLGIAWAEFKRTYIVAKRCLVFGKGEENIVAGSNFSKILNAHNFKEFGYALGVHLGEDVDEIKSHHRQIDVINTTGELDFRANCLKRLPPNPMRPRRIRYQFTDKQIDLCRR